MDKVMTNAAQGLTAFDGKKYLSLETFRKSGKGVRTPVWFAAEALTSSGADIEKLYVYTTADSGKAKRVRQTGAVRIAPCDVRGNVTGSWIDAHAEIVDVEAYDHGMRLIDRKYWPWKQLLDLFARLRPSHQRVMLAIAPV